MGRCEKLKWNRRKLGLSQAELAKKVGVSQRTICNLENDETAWAAMRDSTTDAIHDILWKLGSWQNDVNSLFKNEVSDDDIREMRKKVKEKRMSLGMSQKDLAIMLSIDAATLCHYEKHDKYWKSKSSVVTSKLVAFVEGKYDVESGDSDVASEDKNSSKKVTDVINNSLDTVEPDIIINKIDVKELSTKAEPDLEPVRDTLNNIIDILQDRMKRAAGAGKNTDVYVHMIAGLCEEYLRGV